MSSGYSSSQVSRPWILSTIGVLSIIIASFSLIADFISLIVANVVTGMATIAAMTPAPATMAPAPAVTQAHTEYVGPQGLPAVERQIVIDGLSKVHSLSDARQKQLDGLLADVGQQIIRLSPDNLTAERVATYATDVREIPSGSGGEPDEMFILGSGRLQISDANAVFFPENSPSPIRSGGGSYTDSDGTHMATEQIAAIVERVRNLSNRAINDSQVASLESELESTSQTLITPSPSVTQAAAQVLSAVSLPDGTVAVTTKTGSMSFSSMGQSFQGIMAINAMRGPPWMGRSATVPRRDATLLMLDAILSFAAAGFLLACGIMMLRNRPASRWMHLGYAGVKVVLAGLSCYAVYTVAIELNASSQDVRSTALTWMLIVAAVGFVYPVVLVITMSLKPVREFLEAATVARIF
jgi:hypothetical protein